MTDEEIKEWAARQVAQSPEWSPEKWRAILSRYGLEPDL